VNVNSVSVGNGALRVSLNVGTATSGTNRLLQVQFGAGANAVVDTGTHSQAGDFTVTLPPGATGYDFVIKRSSDGRAVTVPITVVDSCGAWKTFVGGGTGAF
jgi:hypothetical protein